MLSFLRVGIGVGGHAAGGRTLVSWPGSRAMSSAEGSPLARPCQQSIFKATGTEVGIADAEKVASAGWQAAGTCTSRRAPTWTNTESGEARGPRPATPIFPDESQGCKNNRIYCPATPPPRLSRYPATSPAIG